MERLHESSSVVVGIGASAGGLEAISELLSHLSPASGFSYLIVQHLGPDHSSLLTEILGKKTVLPVTEAIEGEAVKPNHLYVIPPNTSMTVEQHHLVLKPRDKLGPPMPIDDLFESLAEDYGSNAIGIVLSGSGSDGALGLQLLKGQGGITFAQDETTARFIGMPRSAIELGCVDFILPPPQIAKELARIGSHSHLAPTVPTADPVPADEESMRRIFRLLRTTCNVDFTHYKRATVKRRISRRLVLHRLETLAEYADFLETTSSEPKSLCQDLLIRVTRFFRDPETFQELTSRVLPRLIEDRPPQTPLRIWVPGCASGEEVYSIAICVTEALGERANNTLVQIFGTDASEEAINTARAGIYIENIARDVSEERLRRFFTKNGAHYHIGKNIRDLCIFSPHDLTRSPPFSRMDLVSCRNLLIYLNADLQKRVIPTFHYALNPGGMLMLGASETIGNFSDLFKLADNKKLKIYIKKPSPGRAPMELPDNYVARRYTPPCPTETAEPKSLSDIDQLHADADRLAQFRYVPAGVLCDEDLNILQFRGDTTRYLAHPSGPPSVNLHKLVRPELLAEVGGAVRQARKDNAPALRTGVRVHTPDGDRSINLEVVPVPSKGNSCSFLIFFSGTTGIGNRTEAPTQKLLAGTRANASQPLDGRGNTSRAADRDRTADARAGSKPGLYAHDHRGTRERQ